MTIGDHVPSAPAPGLVLFNSEDQSDLVFNVGTSIDEIWRIPAHSFVVSSASPVFAKLIDSGQREITINASPQQFHRILSFIYKKEVAFESVSSTLSLISLSQYFQLPELTECCIHYLRTNITLANVMDILDGAYKNSIDDGQLLGTCLSLIDRNADSIFLTISVNSIEKLDQNLLESILNRDSLCLSSEILAFDAIVNWSGHQCLRKRLAVTADNKRQLLGSMLFAVRYLLMSREEFLKGPYTSDLLTDEEKKYLLAKISGESIDDTPPTVKHLFAYKLDTPRSSKSVSSIHSSKMKKSASKKLLNGLSGFVVCVIQLLD